MQLLRACSISPNAARPAWWAVLLALMLTIGVPSWAAPKRINIGILRFDDRPDYDAAVAGLRDGLALARLEPTLIERHARGDGDAALKALNEMRIENVDLVFAIGSHAAQHARDGFRRGAVVFTGVSEPDALGLTGSSNCCGTAGGVEGPALLKRLRSLASKDSNVGVYVAADDPSAEATLRRLERAANDVTDVTDNATADAEDKLRRILRITPAGTDPDERALKIARALEPTTRVLFIPPEVSRADVAALAGALANRGVALVGSRPEHLDAGCAVVIRADARALGTLAVVQAKKVLDGDAPSTVPVRRARRVRLEVNLNAAARLGYAPPLTVIAGADRVVRRFVRSPR